MRLVLSVNRATLCASLAAVLATRMTDDELWVEVIRVWRELYPEPPRPAAETAFTDQELAELCAALDALENDARTLQERF